MTGRTIKGTATLAWLARLMALLAVLGLAGGGWAWWHVHHWLPDRTLYPTQGVEIGVGDGDVSWNSLKAIGADFAYVDASSGAEGRDARFVANMEAAKAAGMQVGAVHRYDPCEPAEKQAANFVTIVPREADLLPPAVELDTLADNCTPKVSDARVESELMTFLNQVETHTGKPTILKVTERFQRRYAIAGRLDRNLWLVRDRFAPDYVGRAWTLWTANSALSNENTAHDLRWLVLHP
ncbi:glycoside hydrolase family 25 protein [Novosphingobium sp. 1949]|uniref:Glycoside hydrolase family 25 protein n=1 Tax=Novosphingobium organovorum TaxID=2930092 RepID=A0ABT0BD87_9SPHN|nr:glycoside hydrolase family 25 protein [Novosphingobium organovorum]MCJ2182987.1 glycoside hydrolase family 25 protein [Novosphingobium organovorum]